MTSTTAADGAGWRAMLAYSGLTAAALGAVVVEEFIRTGKCVALGAGLILIARVGSFSFFESMRPLAMLRDPSTSAKGGALSALIDVGLFVVLAASYIGVIELCKRQNWEYANLDRSVGAAMFVLAFMGSFSCFMMRRAPSLKE